MDQTASAPTSGALLMYPFFAERPHIAVGIKGPMNFWIWYDTKITPHLDFRAVYCRSGVPPDIEVITLAGGTPALHFKSPNKN
jgi:hypothetical protein